MRPGRTGRAGKQGTAITFLTNDDEEVMYVHSTKALDIFLPFILRDIFIAYIFTFYHVPRTALPRLSLFAILPAYFTSILFISCPLLLLC